ncbi:MAG: ATP-binding protein [Lachnospiraceae bacterium]|nr:ATP-binding protein [Lachnospiraceae bacterium]MCM1302496.1 ATP-binding protein [Butyrivibrio sp.]MCM1344400.1 ATP-binding protein [Muribaculaceae bacterium]MCM1237985.1 ATP-binding protein [Lachnospiraceae bacterium]MCM1305411.1 ATP-binding protein [Butyrivibrio sp.]
MAKVFNVNGACKPTEHYMVDLGLRLEAIKAMVDRGEYFAVNRARQYGKTTTLRALAAFLRQDYAVISLDFQKMSSSDFVNESAFVNGLAREVEKVVRNRTDIPDQPKEKIAELAGDKDGNLKMAEIFECFSEWCGQSERPVVLIIDEADTAANNQVFLDFLAQLRAYYLDRDVTPVFQSVILAGVYDVRNMKRKIRPEDEHKQNSPWNIAADFDVEMSFSAADIAGMLDQYEADFHTGMDVGEISGLIYDYTSGYPFLVSRLCKLMDEKITGTENFEDKKKVWTRAGVLEAVKRLLSEKNTLFESLIRQLNEYPELKDMIYLLMFQGQVIAYNADDQAMDMLLMFGFVKAEHETVQIANRIFETRLYNYFLTLPKVQNGDMYRLALRSKNQFIKNGQLDMELILAKFVEHFDDIYGDSKDKFVEEDGRRYFMLYLKPIINGTGNFYVESRTRNQERTDLIVDYNGSQFIIEMKIWRGDSYNERGEEQLAGYLEHYHLKTGYMLSFNFNQKKEIGLKKIRLGDKVLVEAVV